MCSAVPVLEQRVFLLEMVAGIVFLALAARSERFLTNDETVIALTGRRGIVWVLWAQLSVLGVAVVAGALGYMRLARLLGGEVLASSYIALVLYAGVRVGQGLLVYLLRAWPVRHLLMVQHHGALLQRRGSQALRGLAVGTWAYSTLDALGLTSRIWSAGTVVLEARYAGPSACRWATSRSSCSRSGPRSLWRPSSASFSRRTCTRVSGSRGACRMPSRR